MGEGVKGVLEVVAAKSTVSNATKWEGWHCMDRKRGELSLSLSPPLTSSLHDCIIMADPSSAREFVDPLKCLPALGEDVQGERFLSCVDKLDDLVQALHSHHGKKGTKALLLRLLIAPEWSMKLMK